MVLHYDHAKFLSAIHHQNGKWNLPNKFVWPIKICTFISEVPTLNVGQKANEVGQSVPLFSSVPPFECQKNTLKIVNETFKFIQVGRPWLISGDKQTTRIKKLKNLMFAVAVRKMTEDCWTLCPCCIRIPCKQPFEFS
jgi:hypothetical protein